MTVTYRKLSELLTTFAAQSINTQLRFDEAFEESQEFLERFVAETGVDRDPELGRMFLEAAALPRSFVRHSELDFQTSVRIERTKGLSVQVLPLNLGYAARYSTARDRQSGFTLTVEQVPHPNVRTRKEEA